MNNNVQSQKKFEVKEVSQKKKQKISYLGTNRGLVTIKGHGIEESVISSNRYKKVFELFSLMENNLNEEIKCDIALSYISLETIVKVFTEIDDKEETFEFFTKNITPKNFFYLINDIDTQQFYHSSDRIYQVFLSNSEDLRAINEFYNEYQDFIENSFSHNLPTIYAFIKKDELLDPNRYEYAKNIGNALKKDAEYKEKMLAFNIVNEYFTLKTNTQLRDASREELFYKVTQINKNWDKILKETNAQFYTIDGIYSIIE